MAGIRCRNKGDRMSLPLGADGKRIDLATARVTVQLVNGQALGDLRIMPGDYVKTERQYGIAAAEMESNARLEWVLYMLWMAAKRRHGYADDFDTWIDAIEDIDFVSVGAAGPGEPAP